MKLCKKCQQLLPLEQFSMNKAKKDNLDTKCKKCANLYSKQHYIENRQHYINKTKTQRQIRKLKNLTTINNYKTNKGCKYCGEKDVCCLDFHHISNKSFTISERTSWICEENLMNEINKCIVLCSNCHRKIHAGRTLS